MKKILKQNGFIILVIIIAIIRLILTTKLTAIQLGNYSVDDSWVVFNARNFKNGIWQGDYNSNTMIKGLTASLFLAFSSTLVISYINFVTLLYIASTILFIYSIKDLIKNKYMLFVIYIVLLFNPIMYGKDIVQRVYRNSFVPALSITIVSLYIKLLLEHKLQNKKKFILYNIAIGIVLALFWNLREDSVWIVPFIVFFGIFIFIKQYKNTKKVLSNILILLIPVFITLIVNNIICLINYCYYGVYQRIDFSSNTSFSKVCNYIKNIEYPSANDKNSVPPEKFELLCELSPTLGEYSEEMLMYIKLYDSADDSPNDGNLDNGWFTWSFRGGMNEAKKYDSFQEADEYCNKIYEELKKAVDEGKIKVKEGLFFDNGTINKFFESIGNAVIYIINFEEIETDMDAASTYVPWITLIKDMYDEIALNKMIYSVEDIELYEVVDFEEQNAYLEKYGNLENVLNNIAKCYQKVNLILFVLGMLGYIVITYDLILKKILEIKDFWIIMSGLIGSIFTIICGIAYINVTACHAIKYTYLSGSYSLLIVFELIGIYYLYIKIKNLKKEKESERN